MQFNVSLKELSGVKPENLNLKALTQFVSYPLEDEYQTSSRKFVFF